MEGAATSENAFLCWNNGSTEQSMEEGPLSLQDSDHPTMVLVSSHFILTGMNNYLSWSTVVRISLAAKDKVGFIDGTLKAPENEAQFKRWKMVDSMVMSWILNSISTDIADTLIYCESAKALWDEIQERYGLSLGLQLYRIYREMRAIQQGTDSVTTYYCKLQKAWGEIDILVPLPVCTCGFTEKLKERNSLERLCQFLMGLNSEFDMIREQILNLDPLPGVSKAFSMVIGVESLKLVTRSYSTSGVEASALLAKGVGFKNDGDGKSNGKKKDVGKKSDRVCDHCHGNGHTKDSCFKLHGYPV